MSNKRELRYGNNVERFLYELSQYESGEDFIGGNFDVYGENENGVESSATIDIIELATDAHQIIKDANELSGDAYNELCRLIGGNWPECKIQEDAPTAVALFMMLLSGKAQ